MCMMNDVDPIAPSRSWVFRLSSRVATKMKVTAGHHPGNGSSISVEAGSGERSNSRDRRHKRVYAPDAWHMRQRLGTRS